MESPATIVWFSQDLRVAGNPAIRFAVERKGPIIPVFIWSCDQREEWTPGAASRWWLHQSLNSLQRDLVASGNGLTIRKGEALPTLVNLVKETGATSVVWNRRYEPSVMSRDLEIEHTLRSHGLLVQTLNGALLFEPGQLLNQSGKPYQVFTPFWKACQASVELTKPEPAPRSLPMPRRCPGSLPLETLELEPKIDWTAGIRQTWQPGREGAQVRLQDCLNRVLHSYAEERDRPDLNSSSRLSPHLHFGEISPRQVWHAVKLRLSEEPEKGFHRGAHTFLRQLIWREFSHYLLFHFPHTMSHPLRKKFERFPWKEDPVTVKAWQQGKTGYPLVDAGMRELWTTGWMHNRVRLVVASFLVKHLLIPWKIGAQWFWDTLVDADLANNALGWQWTAGCGADAAPYFRIFNLVLQGERFDPRGDCVCQWVPELKRLPASWIQKPWQAPLSVLKEAGVELGGNYPRPIIDHVEGRTSALQAMEVMKQSGSSVNVTIGRRGSQ